MKGLLIKDFSLFKNEFLIYFILFTIFGVGAIIINQPIINMTACIVLSSLTISTLSYDSYDNGYAFLFTLPFTRKEYVLEKYGLALGLNLIWLIGYSIVSWILYKDINIQIVIMFSSMIFVYNSVMIPLYIKYSAEKAKVVLGFVTGFIVAIYYFLFDAFQYLQINGIFLFVTVCMFYISYRLSLRIIQKKEY